MSSSGRILVVEDEAVTAMAIERVVEQLGAAAVCAGRLAEALQLVRTDPPDGAVLDLSIGGQPVFPVADLLHRQGIPFVFVTGYGDLAVLPPPHAQRPVLSKPFRPSDLAALLVRTCGLHTHAA